MTNVCGVSVVERVQIIPNNSSSPQWKSSWYCMVFLIKSKATGIIYEHIMTEHMRKKVVDSVLVNHYTCGLFRKVYFAINLLLL